jgi:putrescine:ornithine antiporter
MMQHAGVERNKYRVNVAVAVIAMGYSTFAIYASGVDAVMGGTIVMATGFIIWGFIAHRFATTAKAPAAAEPASAAAAA